MDKNTLKPTYWFADKKCASGHVIVLNGTSSSGKSSIASELQKVLREPYLVFSIDNFLHTFPLADKRFNIANTILPMLRGFYRSAMAYVSEGNNVIVDAVFQDGPHDFKYVQKIFDGAKASFIGVRCNLDELKKRENQRTDRNAGMAEFQFPRVHQGVEYDFEVDTTYTSPRNCADLIIRHLEETLLSGGHGSPLSRG
ncbi:chloramphenicol phosphotransferase CPT family protein [Elusimicrobiota bacterium]